MSVCAVKLPESKMTMSTGLHDLFFCVSAKGGIWMYLELAGNSTF